ncbi:MAG: endo-1,4-beta-xylanase [Bacteroidetes bacterium]|nr:endo-1,4-beta-xylanase [Bacteroidota bacterium]
MNDIKLTFLHGMLSLLLAAACSKDKTTTTPQPVTPADTSLQKMMPFPFGAAVNVSLLKNRPAYLQVVTKEYNSLTPEVAMKIAALHPSQNTYSWTDADWLVDYAVQNKKRVHGHTLVWHQSLPSWVTGFQGDSAAWEDLLKTHIQTVVAHFKGKVGSWDVVNEAFEDDGTMRKSVWYTHLGPDFIARCFQYAHAADPAALLFYNDYGHEYSVAKRTAIINMVTDLKNRGIPIHGIGLQMHTRYNMSTSNIAAAINAAAATGLKVHIAELDIALNPNNDLSLVLTPALLAQQAQQYKFVVQTYHAIPAAQQFGITTWNVGDLDSWIPATYKRPDWPLPFDSNYGRKQAYYGILEGGR